MSSNFLGDSLNNQAQHLRGDQSAGKSAEESSPKVLSPLEKHIQRRRKQAQQPSLLHAWFALI